MANDGSQPPQPDSAKAKKPTVRIDIAKLTRELAGARPPTAPAYASATPVAASTFRPLPATLPPGSLEAVLHTLLREHGARVYESRRLFRSFMADALAGRELDHLLAVNTMALLAEEGVPARLIAAKPDKLDELLQHEAASLARQHALQPAVLTEALRCWAAALRPEVAVAGPSPNVGRLGAGPAIHAVTSHVALAPPVVSAPAPSVSPSTKSAGIQLPTVTANSTPHGVSAAKGAPRPAATPPHAHDVTALAWLLCLLIFIFVVLTLVGGGAQ